MRFAYSAALAALAAAAPVVAQDAATAPTPHSDGTAACELHVWPGHDFHAVYYGWLHGGTVDGALKGRKGYDPIPIEPLSAARQTEILRDLPVGRLLGLVDFATVLHDQPLSSREIRAGTARHAISSPDCYAELMIDDLVIHKNVLSGTALNILYRFRQFEKGDTPKRSYGTYIQQPLRLFPPAPRTDEQPALNELVTAYRKAFEEFGQALQKPPRPTRGARKN